MTAAAVDDVERNVPTTYEGKLEPNWFCRAWSGKRSHYCRRRAGHGTPHLGSGRCKYHGGNAVVKHGLQSRYAKVSIAELVQQHLADPDPLNLLPELATLRALLESRLQKKQIEPDAAAKLITAIASVVARIEKIRSENAISRPEFFRLMQAMAAVVEQHVSDPVALQRISDGWLAIRTL